jgi:hypothetical protein
MTTLPAVVEKRNQITRYIKLRMADQMVDVELDKEHIDLAIDQSIVRYRQLAQNSTEESYVFLDLVENTTDYVLPDEVKNVRQIFRRGIGSTTGNTATHFEPFSAGYLNTYMLVGGRVGGLLSYEIFANYQKQTMKMFGGHINFSFNPATRVLSIVRKIPVSGEQVALWADIRKSDQILLADDMIFPWIQDHAYGMAKHMVGEAREKHGNIAGPQGGVTLNGTAMKAEGQKIMDDMVDELRKYTDGSAPLSFIIG